MPSRKGKRRSLLREAIGFVQVCVVSEEASQRTLVGFTNNASHGPFVSLVRRFSRRLVLLRPRRQEVDKTRYRRRPAPASQTWPWLHVGWGLAVCIRG